MSDIVDFSKGLNSDNSEINQPKGTYRYMFNGVNISEEGDIFNPSNEKGTINKVTTFPEGFKIIGGTTLNTDFICFLVDPNNGYSQVGIIDSNFVYTRKAPSNNIGNQLRLIITKQVSCVARKLFTGERIVYYADDNTAFSSINLDNPAIDADLASSSRLIPNQQLAIVDLKSIKENVSGELKAGVYQIITRYKTASLNPTSFGIPSNPIPVVENTRSEGRSHYDGEYQDYGNINKALEFEVTNLDTSYPYLEVVVIYYEGISNTFTAKVLPLINISSDTITFLFNGAAQDATSILQSDIQQLPISYSTAKCLTQKDDRLFASNLKETSSSYDAELQEIANNIIVKYKVKEIQYLDGLSGTNEITFTINQVPFLLATGNDLNVEYTDKVDPTTGLDLSKYTLKDAGAVTSSPTSAIIDPSNDRRVILTFVATIDNTYTLEIASSISNYQLSQTYDSGGMFLAITYGEPFEVTGDNQTGATFTDYKDEYICFTKKGYQRDEIYSLGMGVIFKDGSTSFVYHIPANNTLYAVNPNSINVINAIPITPGTYTGDTTGQLGVYKSTVNYPISQNYPVGVVRHHKMPSLIQEPHFRYDSGTTATYIRLLGLEFTINNLFSTELQEAIQGVVFFRQRRNIPTNRSIVAQGLVTRLVKVGNDYAYDGGNVDVDTETYKKTPFFNKSTLTQASISFNGGSDSAALYYGSGENDKMAFFSPESIFGSLNPSEASGANLRSVLKLTGYLSYNDFQKSRNQITYHIGYYTNTLARTGTLRLFNNYYKEGTTLRPLSHRITTASQITRGNVTTLGGIPIDSTTSTDYLYLKTSTSLNDVGFGVSNNINVEIKSHEFVSPGILDDYRKDNNDSWSTTSGYDNHTNNLFNIVKDNLNQYGQISAAEYIPIVVNYTVPTINPTVYTEVYGGDTFISKFSFVNKEIFKYRGIYMHRVAPFGPDTNKYTNNDTDDTLPPYDIKGYDLRGLSYYFVESMINCNYRHQYIQRPGEIAGVKYYPYSSAGDVLNEDPRNGDSTSYNTQYSFENNVKLFYSKGISYQTSTSGTFETRTIYSEQVSQDDLTDNFRIFLQNSYSDLPKHTGPIWNSFVHNNTLYLHTPKSLWRTFVNEVGSQATSQGDVVLGAGGVFTLPSKETYTSGGGYAGTISQFGGTHTPFGYIFPDALQGKVFMLGDSLEEISQNGLMQHFNKNLSTGLVGSTYIDNPSNFNSAGILGVYDYALKRYIISKRGTSADFTLSLSLLNKTWISYHGYFPHFLTSINNRLFGFNNNNTVIMHEHNVGARGVYYGATVQPWILEYVSNNESSQTKVADNIYLRTHSEDSSGNYLDLETFKYIRCRNEKQDTGVVILTCTNAFNDTSNVKKKQDQFQIAIPRNAVGVNALFPDRMKGKYLKIRLSYPNTNNYKLLLNYIVDIDRPVAR